MLDVPKAVIMMIGSGPLSGCLISLRMSMPLLSGIRTSIMMSSGGSSDESASITAEPVSASVTSNPSSSSRSWRTPRIAASSSTIMILGM